ncbi:MAG TPA: methyltransferase [Longimicrobium sp.]|nr:methyltransferase [Longimicrobium sp.]
MSRDEWIMTIIGLALSLIGLACGTYFSDRLLWLAARFRKGAVAGLYRSRWEVGPADANSAERVVEDFVEIQHRGRSIRGEVFYSPRRDLNYTISGSMRDNLIYGEWKNKDKGYLGYFLWQWQPQRKLTGCWMGPDRERRLHSGNWELVRCEQGSRQSDLYFNERKHRTALLQFIGRLETTPHRTEKIDSLELEVLPGVFPPQAGYVSLECFEVIKEIPAHRVLDIGTGCGLYALHFAQRGATVVGVDISQASIQCARHNANKNRVANVDFVLSDLYDGIDETARFDLICANLPFTLEKYTRVVKDSPYHKSLSMKPETLKRFIIESRQWLAPGGKVYFTFGSSGDYELVETCASLASLKLDTVKVIHQEDAGETFLVLSLTPS